MSKLLDLTGQRFGKLTALTYIPRGPGQKVGRWHCKCDCGGESYSTTGNLRRGNSTSCGCKRSESRSTIKPGMRIGRLTILRRDGSKRHGNKGCFAAWKCLCDCGEETRVIGMSLANGDTRSCGCLLSETTAKRAVKQIKDLTNQRFGWLTVLCRASRPGKGRNLRWLCKCLCGELTIVPGSSLTCGNTASCGCARELNMKVRPTSAVVRSNRNSGKRRATKNQAYKPFNQEFFELVEYEAYSLAQERTRRSGIRWVVDHIVPLRSSIVCGLHNEFNLAVIPHAENASKGNRYWPDMP